MRVNQWFKYRHKKSQISSTKLQINLKFQYSMTKTFGCNELFGRETTGRELRVEQFPSTCSPPEPAEARWVQFGILVIEICLIFGICYLVFPLLRL
jgi:hypothetical protein